MKNRKKEENKYLNLKIGYRSKREFSKEETQRAEKHLNVQHL